MACYLRRTMRGGREQIFRVLPEERNSATLVNFAEIVSKVLGLWPNHQPTVCAIEKVHYLIRDYNA